jgi:catechol 2,3-dioxygenase-like lactoylglutathione lyase family enzyme
MPTDVKIRKLHHAAWRCIDAEQTRHFYEDLVGLPLVHTIQADTVPSTGDPNPYFHIFFALGDGSCIAFFDLGDKRGATVSSDMPKWVNHFAMEVDTVEEVVAMKERLERAGVDVLGITDHHFVKSIYFFDPNGLRLEVTALVETPAYLEAAKQRAHGELAEWTKKKTARAAASGK